MTPLVYVLMENKRRFAHSALARVYRVSFEMGPINVYEWEISQRESPIAVQCPLPIRRRDCFLGSNVSSRTWGQEGWRQKCARQVLSNGERRVPRKTRPNKASSDI